MLENSTDESTHNFLKKHKGFLQIIVLKNNVFKLGLATLRNTVEKFCVFRVSNTTFREISYSLYS